MTIILEPIIASSSPVIVTDDHEIVDEPLALVVSKLATGWEEPILEISEGLFSCFEASEVVLAHEHHLDNNNNFFSVLLKSHETLFHELTVFSESSRSISSKDLYHLCCQLERSLFKFHSLTWGIGEEKSKINVHEMSLDVNENISVVSILNLKDIAQ